MQEVKALAPFSNNLLGSKEKDDKFDYDMAKDPADLKKLGLVEPVASGAGKAKG